jgi:hypothetical protein
MISENCLQEFQNEMTQEFVYHWLIMFIHVFHVIALLDYAAFRFQYENCRKTFVELNEKAQKYIVASSYCKDIERKMNYMIERIEALEDDLTDRK